jgi:TolB-like protein/DNA-binding winged helix-turn-helix (wHTH) protein/thioredoxin-like negative regulator of GroEL
LARLEAVVEGFRIATWLIEPRLNAVSRNGATTRLEPKVMEVLVCLAHRAGEPVSKEELLQTVWPDTFVTDDGLKRSISELRRVFEDDAREPLIIQTIPKRGYRLLVPVEPVIGKPGTSPEPLIQESPGKRRNWRTLALLSGGLAAALLILLGAPYGSFKLRPSAKSAAPQIHSLAVLPLRSLSSDPNQEYFSDGTTDALITDLAQISSLKVISHTSTLQYKDTKKSLPEIAGELNVDGIIEGTVQRSGDRVRITAQLIHGPSDRHLWANTYEGDFRDVFALERNVSQDIARQVQARLMSNQSQQTQPRPTNPKALDAYLQGSYHLQRYGRGAGVEEMKKASDLFHQAIDADPKFAPAYFGLAHAHDELPQVSPEDTAIARKAEETGLALDPNSPEAQTILADNKMRDLDWSGAEREYRRAVALNPNNAAAHEDFCEHLSQMGRLDEALNECQLAQELDPNNDHLAAILYRRGEYDHAIDLLQRSADRHSDDGALHYLLFECYVMKQDDKDAIKELERALALYGLTDAAASIPRVFAASGFRAAMLQWAKEIESLQAKKQFYMPVNLADAYAVLGDKDRAFYWLSQAIAHRDAIAAGEPATWMGTDPMLESLRTDPRFKDLMHRIGLPS